jgi:hypothetical protein
MMPNSNKQVPRKHYFEDYDSKERWAKYWYQINEVLKTGRKKILDIVRALSIDREQERIKTVWRRSGC